MNSDFLRTAFTSAEYGRIATVTNQNLDNTLYGIKGGNLTQDRVFALSIVEAGTYFRSNDDRTAAPTAYAVKRGALISDEHSLKDGRKIGWWWLRSPGYIGNYAAFVNASGHVNQDGNVVFYSTSAIRPAFWLNL